MPNRIVTASVLFVLIAAPNAVAQEKIRISYSSADATNSVYFIAQERGFYKKHGVDVDLVFIQSTPISVTASVLFVLIAAPNAVAQEKIRISYSSADATNSVYFIAQERGFYKKHGVAVDQ